MKTICIALAACLLATIAGAQSFTAPSAGKAVLYFLRPSGFGGLVNFSFFDSAQVIGRISGEKYLRYECEPGTHIFWARSENRDYLAAELQPGEVYLVEAVPQMGGIKAGVQLRQIDPADEKKMKQVLKLLAKREPKSYTAEELTALADDLADVIQRGLEKLATDRQAGQLPPQLNPAWTYRHQ